MASYKNKRFELNNKTYTLLSQIGSGGSGCVWKVISADGQKYAIKFLHSTEDHAKIERFKNEIHFCTHSNHPNILKVYDEGSFKGQPFYVMPLYNGTLREIISSERNYMKLLDYSIELIGALCYIHNLGISHRDIKPENVFIDAEGHLVLGDFGVAHFAEKSLTTTSDWLGNKNYASPEQMVLRNAKNITTACDIYSFGLILNELFTKRKPSGLHFKEISDHYPHLQALDDVVHRCLLQNPFARPSSESLLYELQLFRGEIIDELSKIKTRITRRKRKVSKATEIIANAASEDVLFARYIFWKKSDSELEAYNENYHGEIFYSVDSFLKNLFFQKRLLRLCQHKFDYESSSYVLGSPYEPLNLNDDSQLQLYNTLQDVLSKYKLKETYQDITGKILKLFSSCVFYHCKEILEFIPDIEDATKDLNAAPLLYIVCDLRDVLDSREYQSIDLSQHISICWNSKYYFWKNDNEENLYKRCNDAEQKEILRLVCERWGCFCRKEDEDTFYVTFSEKEKYERFKADVIDFSKPYYVLSADVRAIIPIQREYEGIVELRLNSFGVDYTLARILGFKEPC